MDHILHLSKVTVINLCNQWEQLTNQDKPSRYLEVHRKRNGHETHLRLIAATVWIGQRLSSWSHTLSLAWTVNGTERKCLANYLQTSSVWKAVSLQKVYNNDKLMGPLSRARPIVHHPSSETCKLITHKNKMLHTAIGANWIEHFHPELSMCVPLECFPLR